MVRLTKLVNFVKLLRLVNMLELVKYANLAVSENISDNCSNDSDSNE